MSEFIKTHKRIVWIISVVLLMVALSAIGYVSAHLYIKKCGITLKPSGNIEPRYAVHFLQNDPDWAQEKIGQTNYSMGGAGCLITSVANAVTDLGVLVTPQELNEMLTAVDGFSGADLIWYKLSEVIPDIDYKYKRIFTGATIEKDLKNEILPIVNVRFNKTGVTHWVLIVGAEDGEFLILDPADRTLTPMPLSTHGKVYAYRAVYLTSGLSQQVEQAYKMTTKTENELKIKESDEESDIHILVWDRENFDGQIVTDENHVNTHNARVVTLDSKLSKKFIETSTYKDEIVLWKGYKTGLLMQPSQRRKIKISAYGHFYAIEGTNGYYVIDDKLAGQRDELVNDFTYKPDLSGFKDYNKLLPAGDQLKGDVMRHIPVQFGPYEAFTFCWHEQPISSTDEIWKFIKWKYNCGVRLAQYSFENDKYLKLLYEDDTYFEWDGDLYGIKYICDAKD